MAIGYIASSDFPQGNWHNLYIHLPFCASKCGYCAFYSQSGCGTELRGRYLKAVRDFLLKCSFPEALQSVYLGGGTPNFLTAQELDTLFEDIVKIVPLSSDCEISCELNPECMTENKLSVLNTYATRLSLGVQSFDSQVRQTLMRRCSNDCLQRALDILSKRTAKHFNIDLIYGISQVPWSVFERDLTLALDQGVDHLSCYALTPEENSDLGLDAPADDDSAADWYCNIENFLAERGIHRYEISNYARTGCECRHNMNVWSGDTLLGVGASAAGFDGKDRYSFKSDIEEFIKAQPYLPDYTDGALRMLEIFAIKLRTSEGWQVDQWNKRYPDSWDKIKKLCLRASWRRPAWWHVSNEKINLTDDGMLFWDDIAMEVLDWVEEFEI